MLYADLTFTNKENFEYQTDDKIKFAFTKIDNIFFDVVGWYKLRHDKTNSYSKAVNLTLVQLSSNAQREIRLGLSLLYRVKIYNYVLSDKNPNLILSELKSWLINFSLMSKFIILF